MIVNLDMYKRSENIVFIEVFFLKGLIIWTLEACTKPPAKPQDVDEAVGDSAVAVGASG